MGQNIVEKHTCTHTQIYRIDGLMVEVLGAILDKGPRHTKDS